MNTMSSTRDWEELFDAQASEPVAWIELAQTLRLGARPVLARLQEIRDATPNNEDVRLEQLGCVRAYMLLIAAALENMLKAIAVKRGFITAAGGELHHDGSVFPVNGHALKDMASSLQLELTPTDVDLLRRLGEYYLWASRYPVPKKARRSASAEKNALLRLSSSDVQLSDDLFDRLLRIALQAA
jgi:hypothetical protein